VGMEAAITKEDPVITAYRCHGWTYTRGVPVKNILAELTGERELCKKCHGCTDFVASFPGLPCFLFFGLRSV